MIETEGGEITLPEERHRIVTSRGVKAPTVTRQTATMLYDVEREIGLAVEVLQIDDHVNRNDQARTLIVNCLAKLETGWHPYDTFFFAKHRETKLAVARGALRAALNRINDDVPPTLIQLHRAENAVKAIVRSLRK